MKPMLLSLRRSLSARMLLLFAIASLLIVCLLVGSLIHGIGSQWRSSIAPHLEQYLEYVNAEIGYPPRTEQASQLAETLPITIYIKGPDTDFSTSGATLNLENVEFRDKRHRRTRQDKHPNISFGELHDRTLLHVEKGDYSVYYELQHTISKARHYKAILISLAILALILGGCYLILRRMLQPVKDIKLGVSRMGAGQLDTRVPVRSDNDLGELAVSINKMAGDIELMLDAKRQLLLGASHELRSPLTRAKIAVQMLDASENRNRIASDLDEMESLVSGIMDSERMKGGHVVLNRSAVDFVKLMHAIIEELHHPSVELNLAADIPLIEVDEVRMSILIRNLINNATTHGAGERMPIVSMQCHGGVFEFAVQDFGPGIEAQHIDKVTEPFYRADPSRTRATGGFGLGLHLCALIAKAHGGEMSIDSPAGKGTTVTVTLPAS